MFTTKIRTMLTALTFAAFALTAGTSFAGAEEEAKIPQTVADHEALATQYKDQETQYRKVAQDHKQMAEAYAKAHPDHKGGMQNPWNAKMQKHCKKLASDATTLATDSEKAASYHTLRAKELQGK